MPGPKSSIASLFAAIFGTIGFSALAGVLATVMVAPAIAVTGITANNTIGIFESLPDYIQINAGHQQNEIVAIDKNGDYFHIATIFDQNREEVDLNQMSDYLKWAAIAGEDRRFRDHGGVDVPSVIRAAIGGGQSGGASTLTMQTVRNILVQQALNQTNEDGSAVSDEKIKADIEKALAPTIDRKLKEMKLAIGLEKRYSKDEILQAYLNIAGFGGNTYGVQAASLQYFSKNASDLTLAEAASLIAIVQYPNLRDLQSEDRYAANQKRRDVIINNMYNEGYVTKAERDEALATPVDSDFVKPTPTNSGCLGATKYFAFACDYVLNSVFELDSLGSSPEERKANFKRGGYTIVTSINPSLQVTATKIVQSAAPKNENRFQLGAAVTSIQVNTGRILIMTQNKDYNNTLEGGGRTTTAVNFSADIAHGGSVGFQPGSTYKPYVLLAFLDAGHGLQEAFNASKLEVNQAIFADSCGGPWGGKFKYKNDSGEKGSYTVMRGTAGSVNSVFVQMASKVDQCSIKKLAQSIGVHNASGAALSTRPSCAIGGCENNIAPITAAAAFAAIANKGVYCAPTIVDRIIDRDGNVLPGQSGNCGQSAVSPAVANTATYAMQGVFTNGTANSSNPHDGTPYMGKTGTTDNAIHVWMVGSSTKVSTAVWVGNIKGKQSLRQIAVNGIQAALLRHVIFRPVAQAIDSFYPGGAFPEPDPSLLKGNPVFVPNVTGKSAEAAKAQIQLAELNFVKGKSVDSDLPAGTVAYTRPKAGESVPRGTEVVAYISNGQAAALPDVTGQDVVSAKNDLNAQGWTNIVGSCETNPTPSPPDTHVYATDPAPGSVVNKAAIITLRYYGQPGVCPVN
ncbi:MAG: transglycosylase domain-containing protein [Microbacteriaceae bacterium]|nr:transglycosylase domain-containing protein [Microbacteriaceae bacterium]